MPKKVIIIIAVLVVLLGAGAASYFFLFKDTGDIEKVELYNYAIKNSFVTNVKDSARLFKTTVVLVADEEKLDEYFDLNQYIIRDSILFILRDLTEEDIKSSDIQEKLRISIPALLNEQLQIESVVSIYFSDFVMQ